MADSQRLRRAALHRLAPGSVVTEGGIEYKRFDGDGRWAVATMINRVRHHVVVGFESQGYTLTQAREMLAKLKATKAERRHGTAARPHAQVSLKAAGELYLQYLRDTGGKDIDKKEQRLKTNLYRHLGGIPLQSMTSADLKRYRTTRAREGASVATINREIAVVSHLFNVASDRDQLNIIPAPPCRIPREKEPESAPVYLKPDQAAALIEAARADFSPHILAFVMVGLRTGMRYSPILRIRIADIDIERRVIWIDKDKAGERQQPMTADLASFLQAYVRDWLPDGSTWLFPSRKGKDGHAVNVTKAFGRVVAAAGLSSIITPHKMRHSMATNAAHAGVDAATLQAMGGWKSRRMVEKYTHAGGLVAAMDKLQGAYSASTITHGLQAGDDETAQ